MTRYRIIFSENALIDIEEAVSYYDSQQKGLGKKFAARTQATLNSVKKNPFYSSVRYGEIRCAVVSVFPFLIHYQVDAETNTIRILAVYNTYRKPLW